MNQKSLDIMKRLLRPATAEHMAKVALARTSGSSFEQLTLADAGLEDEVRELLNLGNKQLRSAG